MRHSNSPGYWTAMLLQPGVSFQKNDLLSQPNPSLRVLLSKITLFRDILPLKVNIDVSKWEGKRRLWIFLEFHLTIALPPPLHHTTEFTLYMLLPSHQKSPSLVSAVLVNTVSFWKVFMAIGFVRYEEPGATPKNPLSGLIARS